MSLANGITALPWQIIGYVNGKPVRAIAGGAPDDDEDEVEGGGDEEEEIEIDGNVSGDADADDEDDDDEDETPPKKAPAKKAAPVKATAKGKGPNYDVTLRREREARIAAQRELKALRLQNESDAERRDREATERAEAIYKPVAVKAAAKAALLAAKYKKDPTSGFRLLDLDLIEVDSVSGEVLGLDEQIEILKTEYSELFASEDERPAPPKRKGPAKIDVGSKPPPVDEPKSSAEKIAAMFGQGVA